MPTSNDMEAGCKATRSIRESLLRATQLISREFNLPVPVGPFNGTSCMELRSQWDTYAKWSCLQFVSKKEERRKTLVQLIKSGCRLFDGDCRTCDPQLKELEKKKWVEQMSTARPRVAYYKELTRSTWLNRLKDSARELITGWGRNLEGCRMEDYIPDQSGCLEAKSIEGGTLSVSQDFASFPNEVRLGTAKTKGKIRVVTMQGANTKKVLRPVHSALYDYLAGFGWLVRGDVAAADFEAIIRDRRDDEKFISGDYEQATNHINIDSVQAIISVIAEEPLLSDEEREVLIRSFRDVTVYKNNGSFLCKVRNGSMMGNLVSFPLLCILNKCCYDMSREIESEENGIPYCPRVGRFNGDDCAFCGTDRFFEIWRETTSIFGLVVQEKKTGISSRWIELNSESFDSIKCRFVQKNFLSYLRVTRDTPGDLLSEIVSGTKGFKGSTKMWLINHVLRYEIAIRGVCASTIPRKLFLLLVKRVWFRKTLSNPLPPFPTTGVDRSIRQTVVSPPLPSFLPLIDGIETLVRKSHVKKWVGVSVIHGRRARCSSEMNPNHDHFRPMIHGSVFYPFISSDYSPTPLSSSLRGSLLRQRKVAFDLSSKPSSSVRFSRRHSWGFTMSELCKDTLTTFFGETWLMPPKSLCGSTLPYYHPHLKIKCDFLTTVTPTFYPPPVSLLTTKTLAEHAATIYNLERTSSSILRNSRVRIAKADSKLWSFVPDNYIGSRLVV
uniref:RNA-dependent RNA polymerase n=1 Tax=Botrytis ourmia-like virus TaxID=1872719 RepID=A0A7D5JJB3_9VIRU|nr:RNA-dependent RNA polymerase [Botrytis ourmia-like virus]